MNRDGRMDMLSPWGVFWWSMWAQFWIHALTPPMISSREPEFVAAVDKAEENRMVAEFRKELEDL